VRDLVPSLTRTGKNRKEIKILVDSAYGDKILLISQKNQII
jgi:hypothetical protein